jgi:23S rRNA-/tRNA-specific pseudouridylate synthase
MTKQAKGNTKFLPKGLEILHEDRDILVVNKPSGLLTIATESEKAKTAYASPHRLCKKRKLQIQESNFYCSQARP